MRYFSAIYTRFINIAAAAYLAKILSMLSLFPNKQTICLYKICSFWKLMSIEIESKLLRVRETVKNLPWGDVSATNHERKLLQVCCLSLSFSDYFRIELSSSAYLHLCVCVCVCIANHSEHMLGIPSGSPVLCFMNESQRHNENSFLVCFTTGKINKEFWWWQSVVVADVVVVDRDRQRAAY